MENYETIKRKDTETFLYKHGELSRATVTNQYAENISSLTVVFERKK